MTHDENVQDYRLALLALRTGVLLYITLKYAYSPQGDEGWPLLKNILNTSCWEGYFSENRSEKHRCID